MKKQNKFKVELIKFFLKRFNKDKYQFYKQKTREDKLVYDYETSFKSKIQHIQTVLQQKTEINFKHSGHMGDLIYALPVIKEIAKTKKCNLFIRVNHSLGKKAYYKHPSGSVMISERMYNMVVPLLENQKYINKVNKWNQEEIDIDLDLFREFPFTNDFHSVRWYYHITGQFPDMNEPSLEANPSDSFSDKIVVVRTFRGRNPLVNYSFLNKYDNLLFLGTKDEYDDFKIQVPNSSFYDVKDFLEMAQIMKSAKFVITNQTFAFALAEGLKVNRILEANPFIPAVFPVGKNGVDFYFQEQFEEFVNKFNK
jgi:hypothetical protein